MVIRLRTYILLKDLHVILFRKLLKQKVELGLFFVSFHFSASKQGYSHMFCYTRFYARISGIEACFYFEYNYLKNYFKNFEIIAIESFEELQYLKYSFWDSFIYLNPVYTSMRTFWFIRIANFFLRNLFEYFSAMDYLHMIWFSGNYITKFNLREFIEYQAPYKREFLKKEPHPPPFVLPPYALIKIVNIGFNLGTNSTPISLIHVWHKLFLKNLKRLKKNSKSEWIPHTKWQQPRKVKLPRKKKALLHKQQYKHKQEIWRWKNRYRQLIDIEDCDIRLQPIWKQLFPRMAFYLR